jgi:hypothetical protein
LAKISPYTTMASILNDVAHYCLMEDDDGNLAASTSSVTALAGSVVVHWCFSAARKAARNFSREITIGLVRLPRVANVFLGTLNMACDLLMP